MYRKKIQTVAAGIVALLLSIVGAAAEDNGPALYNTPEDAGKALIVAAKANDAKALAMVFGPGAKDLIDSGDATADSGDRALFVAAWEKKHILRTEADGRVSLVLGDKELRFPVPLVKNAAGKWFFDGKAGLEELMNRRIGRNELSAMEVCQAIADAQRDYYALNPDHAPVRHFAPRILSSPDRRDGLYWPTKDGEKPSPLGALVADAADEGYNKGAGAYHGYRYRILSGQGKNAPGGAYGYAGNGLMLGGFAVLAYPEKYGVSGVMTFLLGHDGTLLEKNLGKDTAALAAAITLYEPDTSWQRVEDDEAQSLTDTK